MVDAFAPTLWCMCTNGVTWTRPAWTLRQAAQHLSPPPPMLARGYIRPSVATLPLDKQYTFRAPNSNAMLRLDVTNLSHLVGIRSIRGVREYNEDRYRVRVLRFPQDAASNPHPPLAQFRQLLYFGVYDGHGGPRCADFLAGHLHTYIQDAKLADLPQVLHTFRQLGSAWQTYSPKGLGRLIRALYQQPIDYESGRAAIHRRLHRDVFRLTVKERLILGYLTADEHLFYMSPGEAGSTAASVVLEPLDDSPYWSSGDLMLTACNVGDTRILLCNVKNGLVQQLSKDHHPTDRQEYQRLCYFGGYTDSDAFGDTMALGKVANTRSFGDRALKSYGVVAEPEVYQSRLQTKDGAFIAIVSDGVTSVLTDQEIVDLAKCQTDSTQAAFSIINAAEKLGSSDNLTAMVIALPGWIPNIPVHTTIFKRLGRALPPGTTAWSQGMGADATASPQDIDVGVNKRRGSWMTWEEKETPADQGSVLLDTEDVLWSLFTEEAVPGEHGQSFQQRAQQLTIPEILVALQRRQVKLTMDTGVSPQLSTKDVATVEQSEQDQQATLTTRVDESENEHILNLCLSVLGQPVDALAPTGNTLSFTELQHAWTLLGVKAVRES
ncbi:Protein phosphatase 2C 6 [Dimargaris verticillata]|uniref:Protein phosphatase 2C 6 n=1 Tax=Dimargaris verticillata TaxID=2761393 RepID=A0A9W8BCK4_9FUNG|nr:Protein phosphatase 2C 6 [Dimargaris verticillata]